MFSCSVFCCLEEVWRSAWTLQLEFKAAWCLFLPIASWTGWDHIFSLQGNSWSVLFTCGQAYFRKYWEDFQSQVSEVFDFIYENNTKLEMKLTRLKMWLCNSTRYFKNFEQDFLSVNLIKVWLSFRCSGQVFRRPHGELFYIWDNKIFIFGKKN